MNTNPKSRRKAILVAVAACALAAGTYAVASGGMRALHEKRCQLVRAHVELKVERALTAADATEVQRQQVEAILERTFNDLKSLHADHEQLHEQALAVLTADGIDRSAIEALQVEHVAKLEQASRVVADAIGDAAEVLTPEQRARLASLAREHFE